MYPLIPLEGLLKGYVCLGSSEAFFSPARVADSAGLTLTQDASLRELVTKKAKSDELLNQPAVFAVAQETQDFVAQLASKGGNSDEESHDVKRVHEMDEEELELEKRIADDLKKKQAMLLRTPDASSPFYSAGVDSEEDDEGDTDSLFDETDDHGIEENSSEEVRGERRERKSDKRNKAEKMKWKMGKILGESRHVRFLSSLNFEAGCEMTIRETKFPRLLSAQEKDVVEKKVRFLQTLSCR